MRPPRFGVLSRAWHPPTGDPTLHLEAELELAELADRLGLHEFWWGEAHSRGWPVVADPMLMVARAAGLTRRVRLGAAMSALTVHHPAALVDSALQLDHLTRGRFALGLGADVVPGEVATAGYRPAEAELAIAETVEATTLLLRGHPVTMTPRHAPWLLRGSAPILAGYDGDLDIRVLALSDSAGPELAGHHGAGLLSASGGDLAHQWRRVTEATQRAGGSASRHRWSIVVPIHVAATEDEARWQVRPGIGRTHGGDVDTVIDGLRSSGRAVVGTPALAAAHLDALIERTGGVGTVLIEVPGWANRADTRASLELIAHEVIPQVRGIAAARVAPAADATTIAPSSERRRGRRAAPTPVRGVPVGAAPRQAVRYDAANGRRGRHAVDVPAAD